ncbi:MAG: hypothetical protein K6E47_15385 [Lachnospiraceae bacterium]|nr:hypothetical protein [Lachnospiraceae bacterium]
MFSVTKRADSVKQPRGGYLNPSWFDVDVLSDGITLNDTENVNPSIVGTAVDYLTRFNNGKDIVDAFDVSLRGAFRAESAKAIKSAEKVIEPLLKGIKGVDDTSIISACKLVYFDVWFRNPIGAMAAQSNYTDVNPDKATCQNIRTMINRATEFFNIYGNITSDGFTFEPEKPNDKAYENMIKTKGSYGGYTYMVSSGDGDFLTADTLWDFKVSKSKPTSKHTLQLLMYWIMGQHSGQKKYKNITRIGIFNPRLNVVYKYDMKKVPADLIQLVEKEIICYP